MECNSPETKENIIYYYSNIKTQPMTKYFIHLVVFRTLGLRGIWGYGIHEPKSSKSRPLPFPIQGGLDKKYN
jgi:hypothetical protein